MLARVRQKGLLNDSEKDYIGRANDKNPFEEKLDGDDEDRVKLEYRDATGKIMAKKSAFRYMCWIFHGQGPGKAKLEKMRRKELEKEQKR